MISNVHTTITGFFSRRLKKNHTRKQLQLPYRKRKVTRRKLLIIFYKKRSKQIMLKILLLSADVTIALHLFNNIFYKFLPKLHSLRYRL